MKNLCKLIFLCLVLTINVMAQPVTWQNEYSDSASSFSDGYSAIQLEDEGFIIVSARSFSSLGISVMRINKLGTLMWRRYYAGTNPRVIVKAKDGNFLIGSNTLYKIDAIGNVIWSRLNSPTYRINLTDDGGFYYCGSVEVGPFKSIPSIKKYDSLGFIQWDSIYSDQFYRGGFNNCMINKDKDIILIGNFNPDDTNSDYPFIMKTDEIGNVIWNRKYYADSLRYFYLNFIEENINGEFMTAGGDLNSYFVSFNSEGIWEWRKYFNFVSPNPGGVSFLIGTNDNGFAFTGFFRTNDTTYKIRLLKTNYDGEQQWVKIFGIGQSSDAHFVSQTSDSGFIITGRRDTFNRAQVYVIKTDIDGNTSPWVNVNSITQSIPEKFTLYQNYPNPFNPNTKIYFDIRSKSHTVLTIYNTLGQKITNILSQDLTPGKYTVDFNVNDFNNLFPSGIYFYSLNADNFTESRKMLLIK